MCNYWLYQTHLNNLPVCLLILLDIHPCGTIKARYFLMQQSAIRKRWVLSWVFTPKLKQISLFWTVLQAHMYSEIVYPSIITFFQLFSSLTRILAFCGLHWLNEGGGGNPFHLVFLWNLGILKDTQGPVRYDMVGMGWQTSHCCEQIFYLVSLKSYENYFHNLVKISEWTILEK